MATAASKALPPRSRTPIPTAVAIQCVEATTPKVPSISGRVVKRAGLMKLMRLALKSAAILGDAGCGEKVAALRSRLAADLGRRGFDSRHAIA